MANYTINNLPNTVSTISNSDLLPVWDSINSRTAKVSVANLTAKKQDLLTFDNVPTENSNNPVKSGGVYNAIANVSGSSAIVASSTTLTGVTLATNQILRIFFSADITGSDTSTPLAISYNGTSYPVMAHKNSALISVYAHEVASGTYKYLQAYTTLELVFDGTQFVIVGNPIVLSSDNYTIYADGFIKQWGSSNYTSISGSNKLIEKTFSIAYSDTPILLCMNLFPAESSTSWFPDVTSLTNTSFVYNTRTARSSTPICWKASGY